MRRAFIPYEKRSKKEQRDIDRARRGSWGEISPVTRRPDNPKAYNRKRHRRQFDGDGAFFMFSIGGFSAASMPFTAMISRLIF